MKKLLIITAIACISIAYGCNDSVKSEKDETINVPQQALPEPTESGHHHIEGDAIELNNGAKWKVEGEMMKHIRNMESDVKVFSKSNNKNLKDYIQQGSGLQKNINLLTSNCTMEGKAHDELHKWLLPYIDLVDKLNKSKDDKEAQTTYKEIEKAFGIFNEYFE